MRKLTADDLPEFLATKPVSVIHFDAEWDVSYRAQVRRAMLGAEAALGHVASFGEVDCDTNPEIARSTPVPNVPLVAYYRDGSLVMTVIGVNQDIRARVEHLVRA